MGVRVGSGSRLGAAVTTGARVAAAEGSGEGETAAAGAGASPPPMDAAMRKTTIDTSRMPSTKFGILSISAYNSLRRKTQTAMMNPETA